MTRDEQKAITAFIQHAVRDCQGAMDVEADAIIRALFVRNPDAAYRMTMLAMAQATQPVAETPATDAEKPGIKSFFFEKKKQKTPGRPVRGRWRLNAQEPKL